MNAKYFILTILFSGFATLLLGEMGIEQVLGLFDDPFVDPEEAPEIIHQESHEAATLKASFKSILLLKNKENFIPLEADKISTILVPGRLRMILNR